MAKRLTPPSLTNLPGLTSSDSDFDNWVEELRPEFLACRDFGHVWRAMTARYDKDSNTFDRDQRCQRCKTNRSQVVDHEGITKRNKYAYPEGYKAPHGTGRFDTDARAAMRLASTLRMIKDS